MGRQARWESACRTIVHDLGNLAVSVLWSHALPIPLTSGVAHAPLPALAVETSPVLSLFILTINFSITPGAIWASGCPVPVPHASPVLTCTIPCLLF